MRSQVEPSSKVKVDAGRGGDARDVEELVYHPLDEPEPRWAMALSSRSGEAGGGASMGWRRRRPQDPACRGPWTCSLAARPAASFELVPAGWRGSSVAACGPPLLRRSLGAAASARCAAPGPASELRPLSKLTNAPRWCRPWGRPTPIGPGGGGGGGGGKRKKGGGKEGSRTKL